MILFSFQVSLALNCCRIHFQKHSSSTFIEQTEQQATQYRTAYCNTTVSAMTVLSSFRLRDRYVHLWRVSPARPVSFPRSAAVRNRELYQKEDSTGKTLPLNLPCSLIPAGSELVLASFLPPRWT